MIAYLKLSVLMRPSCYTCKFKGEHRNTDITLADFWGIARTQPSMDTDEGTSVVLLNSDDAKEAFGAIQSRLCFSKASIEEVAPGNQHLRGIAVAGENRADFYAHLGTLPFPHLVQRYYRITVRQKLRRFLGRCKRKLGL